MEPSGTSWEAPSSVSPSSARTSPDLFQVGHSPSLLADTPSVIRWAVVNEVTGLIIKPTFGNFLATRPLVQTHLSCFYLSKNKTCCFAFINLAVFCFFMFFYSTELQTLLWTSPANSRSSSLLLTAVQPRNGRSTISPREAVEWACTTQMRWVHIFLKGWVCCNRVKGIPIKHTAVFLTQYIIKNSCKFNLWTNKIHFSLPSRFNFTFII